MTARSSHHLAKSSAPAQTQRSLSTVPSPESAMFRRLTIAAFAITFGATALIAQQDTTRRLASRKPDLELVPGRSMNLDTDEGTWISLDVSPDGRTIVFDLLGDLYTMPIAGGPATGFTSGMAYDA